MISNSKILIPRVSSRAIQRTQFEFGLPWPQWWLTQSSKIDFRHGKLVFIGQMTFIQSSKIRKKVQKNSWNRFLPKTIWFLVEKSISRIFLHIFRILEHCAFVVIPLLLLLRIGINFIALTFVTFGVTRILKKKLTSLLWQWLLENCGSSV